MWKPSPIRMLVRLPISRNMDAMFAAKKNAYMNGFAFRFALRQNFRMIGVSVRMAISLDVNAVIRQVTA